jgi:pimeloyl-ACP methyl ester carboxylesterase
VSAVVPGIAAVIALHTIVTGASPASVEVGGRSIAFSDLSATHFEPGRQTVRFDAPGVDAIEIPPCAGRGRVTVAGTSYAPPPGPFVVRTHGAVEIEITVSSYEQRIACGYAPRMGKTSDSREGLGAFSNAVVFIPSGHDTTKPSAVLVGLHPWDGGIWTYAAYAELLSAAQKNDVVLLFPSGLGNSLYTRAAELEVVRAMDALSSAIAVDPRRVSIWGASMGGAGATTIGLHRPDRFASITSLFGDSKYDLSTYVKSILPTPEAAHAVDSLDLAPNARHVPVWLIHGEADRVSPIEQSAMLFRALEKNKYGVRFDRVPNMGHSGALVARNAAEIVQRAATLKSPEHPARVTFASARDEDVSAYGVRLVRAATGDAFVDVELSNGAIRVFSTRNVKEIVLAKGALGSTGAEPITGAPARFE